MKEQETDNGGFQIIGAFGWVIAAGDEILTRGRGTARGEKRMMSSFRPKATGLY